MRKLDEAAAYAAIGAALAFFGSVNGTALGFASSPSVALGYVMLVLICGALMRTETVKLAEPAAEAAE